MWKDNVFASYTMLIVILHSRERLFFFHVFQNAFRLAERFEKVDKKSERVCNSTISMGEGGKNQSFFLLQYMNYIIDTSLIAWGVVDDTTDDEAQHHPGAEGQDACGLSFLLLLGIVDQCAIHGVICCERELLVKIGGWYTWVCLTEKCSSRNRLEKMWLIGNQRDPWLYMTINK